MAVQVASMTAVLDLDQRGLVTGLKSASSSLGGFGNSIKGIVGTFGLVAAGAAVFSGVGAAIGGMVNEARGALAVQRELTQVIKASNGIAGVTVKMANDWANALSLVTNFTDDAILATENMLLTFTNISSDVFPAALEAGLDIAQFFKMEGPAAAKMWGKALNDPAKGLNTLTRMGVTFTDQQKAMVKQMMAVNDVAGAQRVMIEAVASQGIGGMARAMADPFIMLQNAIGEVSEALGMAFLPALNALSQTALPGIRAAAQTLGEVLTPLGKLIAEGMGAGLIELGKAANEVFAAFTMLGTGVKMMADALGIAGGAKELFLVGLTPLLVTLKAVSIVVGVVGVTLTTLGFTLGVVTRAWGAVASATDKALGLSAAVAPVFDAIGRAGTTLWQIIEIIRLAWVNLIRAMSQPFNPPTDLTPGSPTPMELALRGLSGAIRSIPPLPSFGASGGMGGMVPLASGGGNVSNTTVINMGGQSMSFSGPTGNDDAIRFVIQSLRQQLDR